LKWRFGGASKIEGHLEVLLELYFCTKPPKFGVEAHIQAPTGVALRAGAFRLIILSHVSNFILVIRSFESTDRCIPLKKI
jgi:hypothetical protein